MSHTLREFVDSQVRQRYGTAQALAMRVGVSLSAFTRGVTGGSLSTESLLRLALETGTPASEILRFSKKEHVAHLIEQLYGKPAANPPSGDIRAIAEAWPALPTQAQQALLVVIRQMAKQHTPAKRKTA